MTKRPSIVNLTSVLFGAWGRQVDDHVLAAYEIALRECSDYQVGRAVDYLIRRQQGEFPPSAATVCERAKVYAVTAEAERAAMQRVQRHYDTVRQQQIADARLRIEAMPRPDTDSIVPVIKRADTPEAIRARESEGRRKLAEALTESE